MMTTLRSDRRTRRNTTFNLECLDDRIVLSAASAVAAAEAHLALEVSLGHAKAVAKATVKLDRDEARLAKIEAKHHIVPSSTMTPIIVTSSSGSASLSAGNSNAASSTTASTTGNGNVTTSTPTTGTSPVTPVVATSSPAATTSTTSTSASTSTSTGPLPSNVSAPLQSVYTQYEAAVGSNSSASFSPTGLPSGMVVSGTNVGINFQSSDTADFNTFLSDLESDGLQVSSQSASFGIIDGLLPIAQLPAVAQISTSASVTPMFQGLPR